MSEGAACLMRSARTPSPLCIPQPRAGRGRLLLNRSSSQAAFRGFLRASAGEGGRFPRSATGAVACERRTFCSPFILSARAFLQKAIALAFVFLMNPDYPSDKLNRIPAQP